MPQKVASVIKEATREKLLRYLELKEILSLPVEFEDYLKDFEIIITYEQVNRAAEIFREKWGLGKGPIFNIVEL